jgi:hypothetical protein
MAGPYPTGTGSGRSTRARGRPGNSAVATADDDPRRRIPAGHFEGRELDLELRFDSVARELHSAIRDLETTRRAIREGLHDWLVFSRDMTVRGDRVLRLLRQAGGGSTVAALEERRCDALDASELRAALARLVELGHVALEGDTARLLPTGWHVGG